MNERTILFCIWLQLFFVIFILASILGELQP